MDLHITGHAKTRFRQRGIDNQALHYLIRYGDVEHAPGGAYKILLTKRNANKVIRALKKDIQKIDRACKVVIVQKDGSILTGYHKT